MAVTRVSVKGMFEGHKLLNKTEAICYSKFNWKMIVYRESGQIQLINDWVI